MKYIGKSNTILKGLINSFGAELINNLGRFYCSSNYDSRCDIFIKRARIISYIEYNEYGTGLVIMTSEKINIQYGVDSANLSISGKVFSINLLDDLLECKSLKESFLKACSFNNLMKKALESITIPHLGALSIRVRCYYSSSNYKIELWFHPNTTIILTGDSTVTCNKCGDSFTTREDYNKIVNWIKNEV